MGRYLDIAKRVMRELEATRVPVVEVPPHPLSLVPPEILAWPIERQELWAERAAILEMDAGLSQDAAEQTALDLCQPTIVPPAAPAEERFEVGSMCPRCRDAGKISHLYVIRAGGWWCVKCLRRGVR
jgi:hypothetical protein